MKEIKATVSHPQNNADLALVFHQMAECYRYMGNAEKFRAIAYENVSKILYNMREDIAVHASDTASLDAIGGIGESIAEKIIEYLHTGKIQAFEKLKKQVPFELLELMDINGFGPATLKVLHGNLKINNRDDLVAAIESNKLADLKGFGESKISNLKKALKLSDKGKRIPLADAEKIANEILKEINKIPGVQKVMIAGSIRRKKETIGDIDIVILADEQRRRKIVNKIIAMPMIIKVLAKGLTKISAILTYGNTQMDIRLVNANEYGAAMLYFTGSREHTIGLRTIAKAKDLKINEYGVYDNKTRKRLAGETEEGIYALLGLKYVPPEKRSGINELVKI